MNRYIIMLLAASVSCIMTFLVTRALSDNGTESRADDSTATTGVVAVAREASGFEGSEEREEMRQTIAGQRREIERLHAELAGLTNTPVTVWQRGAVAKSSRASYLNRIEEEDPERHRRILERLHAINRETEEALADSAEFLFNLDMSLMNEEQVANHQKLLELMEDSWKQLDVMKADPQGKDAQEAKAKLRGNVMAMRKAYETERQAALEQWCQWKGITPDEAAEARAEIEAVYERTDPSKIIPGTRFVGESVMITVDRQSDGGNSHTIMMNMDASFKTE